MSDEMLRAYSQDAKTEQLAKDAASSLLLVIENGRRLGAARKQKLEQAHAELMEMAAQVVRAWD